MHRDSRLYLDDIFGAIDHIREYTLGLDYEAFQRDRKTQDAVVRNLEIIGEAGWTSTGISSGRSPRSRMAQNYRPAQYTCSRIFRCDLR